MTTTALVMAAGSSSRLGRAKQLLRFQGRTLVEHSVREAWRAGVDRVVVVLGCHANSIEKVLAGSDCEVHVNADWESGLGSSIAAGVVHATAQQLDLDIAKPDAALIVLCDQPRVPENHLKHLLAEVERNPTAIAATRYPDSSGGIPACFPAAFFPRLAQLSGARGAKKIIQQEQSTLFDCPEALLDIDTEKDIRFLK